MKIIEITDNSDYIELRQNSWLVVIDGIKYLINPLSDKLIYQKNVINIKKIHLAFQKLRKSCFDKHNHKAKVYFSHRNSRATAWYE